MDLNPRGTPATRGTRGKSSLLPRNSFRSGPPNPFCPPPLHVNSQGPPISSRGPRDHSLAGAPPMLGPPGNLDSLSGRSNFGRPDRMSMGVPDRGPLRNRDFAPSPPREMRRDYRNESHDYERSGLLPHEYDSYRNYGPPDFPGPPPSGNYSFYGPSSTNAHFNYMHDQKMPADEPGGYAIPFHGTNNANDLYPSPQIAYHLALNKLPTKRKAQTQPFSCNVCNVNFNSEQQAAQHFSSVRHVKKMRMMEPGSKSLDVKEGEFDASLGNKNALSKKQVFTCESCKITVNSLHQLEAHKSGSKHQTRMSQMDPNNPMETEDDHAGGSDNNSQNTSFDKKTVYTCNYCNIIVNSLQQLEAHKSGTKHQAKVQTGGDSSSKQIGMDEDFVGGDMNNLPLLSSSFDKKAVFTCEYCKITVNSLHQLEAHKNGSKHQSKVSQTEPGKQMENNNSAGLSTSFDKKAVFTCDSCNVTVNSLQQLEAHKIGSKHQAKVQQLDPSKQMEASFVSAINNLKLPPSSEVKQSFTCVYCNISVNSLQQLEAHMSGSKHQAKLQKAEEEK